jgi:hypothetical protein
MTKTKLNKISKALDDAQAAFRTEIDKLAKQARTEILLYFKKYDLDFTAGNGDWVITRPGDRVSHDRLVVDDDDLPKKIRDLLMLEVAYGDHLGFYIRDIKRAETAS